VKAGAAAVRITPLPEHLEGPLYLGGYGSFQSRRASGVHDDLWSRALAMAGDSGACVLAALDLVGISHAHLDDVQRRASRATGIPSEHILIACTHSHAAPDLQGLWGGVPAAYAAYLRTQAVQSIVQAVEALEDVEAAVGRGEVTGLVRNRRGWDHTDPEVTVLRFRRPGGGAVATLVNFACHAVVTTADNREVSCDFPRYLVDALESACGGMVMFVNGAEGDVNPAAQGGFEDARRMGDAAARIVLEALQHAEPLSEPLSLRSNTVYIPLGTSGLPPAARMLLTRGGPLLRVAARFGLLQRLARRAAAKGGATPTQGAQTMAVLGVLSEQGLVSRGGRPHAPTRVAVLEMGPSTSSGHGPPASSSPEANPPRRAAVRPPPAEGRGPLLRGVAVPGEAVTRLGLPLKEALGSPYRLFLGLTYDTLGYLIPADEWMNAPGDNYEESVSLGRQAGPTVSAALMDLISRASGQT
jgi:hypothetical protein